MTQPTHLPRPATVPGPQALRLEARHEWSDDRPGALAPATEVTGASVGSPGPNQGFALTLAHRVSKELVLVTGENAHDVEVGAAAIACRRASLFGRAPQIYDVRLALAIFGFLGGAPVELVALRRERFSGVGHSYPALRALVDSIPEATLLASVSDAMDVDWTVAVGA